MASNSRHPNGPNRNNQRPEGPRGKENNPAKRSPRKRNIREQKPKVEWAETSSLVSTRKQLEIDHRQAKKAEEECFLKLPPVEEMFAVTGYFVWPNEDIDPDELLGERLNNVRRSCHVYIRFLDTQRCLRIDANKFEDVEKAIESLRATLKQVEAETSLFAPVYIIEPPSLMAKKNYVSPVFNEASTSGKRSIRSVILSGPDLSSEEREEWSRCRDSVLSNNKRLFLGRMKDALEGLRGFNGDMKLQVHFGRIELQRYKKGFGQDYPYEDFVKMMGQPQTIVEFNTRVGGLSFASKIIESLGSNPDLFCPVDPMSCDLISAKPRHSLLIWARGPSKELVRLEADIDPTDIDYKTGINRRLEIGTVSCFRHEARKVRLRVGVLGFETNLHWSLELATEDRVTQIPAPYLELLNKSLCKGDSGFNDEFGFRYPKIVPRIPDKVDVEEIRIRSTVRYWIQGTSYILEIRILRQVKGDPSGAVAHCEISLKDNDWNSRVSSKLPSPSELFSTEGLGDGFQGFLNIVAMVQDYMSNNSRMLP